MTRVHLVEPGGRGGVQQHAVALADALRAAGADVTLYTADDHEALPLAAPRRTCLWRFSTVRPRRVRQAAIVLGWLLVGVPSCTARLRRGDVVHLQRWFHPPLWLPLAWACHLRGCVLAFSPHTTFDRRGGRMRSGLVAWLARAADVVFAFSDHDATRIRAWGADPVTVPFPVLFAAPRPDLVAAWRARWLGAGGERVVLFAGLLRPDKGLDRLIRAAAGWEDDVVLAVVGADDGALASSRALAERLGVAVIWDVGYHAHDRFVAAVAAADVVACPYRVASQSAVLALARAAGTSTVASAVGGLPELATVTAPASDPVALIDAVRQALAAVPPRPPRLDVAAPYLEAYAAAGGR